MSTYYDTDYLARLTVKRLAEMNRTRAKVEELERRANLATDYELERRRLRILSHLSDHYQSLGPQLKDMGLYITELKAYLQSVYDAELLADGALQDLATEHCIAYTVHVLDLMCDRPKSDSKGSFSVMELASSTLAMFAGRPSAIPALLATGALPAMTKALSPLFPSAVVINLANAMGSIANNLDARLAVRAAGGVGALVRLLRSDVEPAVQSATAAALSLLSARDTVIQDSVRYLGGIDNLVALLGSNDSYLAEVARLCLVSLRHGNVKNQAEVITAMRASTVLSKDIRKLEAAADLLRFVDSTPLKPPSIIVDDLISSSLKRRPVTADSYARPGSASGRLGSGTSVARGFSTSLRSPGGSTVDYTASAKDFSSLSFPASPPDVSPRGDDFRINTTLAEVESEILRKKHLARFSSEEVCLLLEEMGFDRLDLRGFRDGRVNGYRLLTLSEDQMSINMLLSRAKVHKVQVLQRAVALFDRIATLTDQGRISEVELRLYLAGHGASSNEISKVIKLLRTLVRIDRYDFVTFWDFVTGYDWVTQAFRIYNIPY